MISVIVPVYNVELYLRKCLDSIIGQTYKDLEILIIDDGSTDESGTICDEYLKDKRVRVFHTENRGLSAARNKGIDEAKGEWIGFVDSDDWIEPEMYEALLKRAEETKADIVECGVFIEYATRSKQSSSIPTTVSSTEALIALISCNIHTQVWNKIWAHNLFNGIRFPEGKSFEDVATTYKLIMNATVTGVQAHYYHWIKRQSSISQCHDKDNLVDFWEAHKQRYEDLKEYVDSETISNLMKFCAYAIARTWAWNLKSNCYNEALREMNDFNLRHYPLFGVNDWPMKLRISILLARFNNRASFVITYILNRLHRALKPKYYD